MNAPNNDYGDLNLLVKVAGWVLSAAWALIFAWRGWSKKWAPVEEEIHGGAGRVAALVTALGLGYLWLVQAADMSQGRWLIPWLTGAAVVTIVVFLLYVSLRYIFTYDREYSSKPNEVAVKKVVGGLWLKREARQIRRKDRVSVQDIFRGMGYDAEYVWSRGARAAARMLLALLFIVVTAGGSVALAAGALAVLSARQPRILEFSVAPLEVARGQTATMHWRVRNANSISIDPLGEVTQDGDRAVRPEKDSVYTLRASNSWATSGVQLGVTVNAPAPVTSQVKPKPPLKPFPRREMVVEARTCELVRNVVIRGEGWLQGETDSPDLSIAECGVTVPAAGSYEIFVRYASAESRPVRITLNGFVLQENALAAKTGGWREPNALDQTLGVHSLRAGRNVLQFRTERLMPHIQSIRLVAR
jgi:hypothetical protein